MPAVRLAMAQINPRVGDFSGNRQLILEQVKKAAELGCSLVVFPELALSGYPIEDLALSPDFLSSAEKALMSLARDLEAMGLAELLVVLGHPSRASDPNSWAIGHNSASVLVGGKVKHTYHKQHLPNYSVFDEYRVFVPGDSISSFELAGLRFATVICEDIWHEAGPVQQLVEMSPDVILVLNGSPFELSKEDSRIQYANRLSKSVGAVVCYVNLVGGQDDLVFDGASFVLDATGGVLLQMKQFESDLGLIGIDDSKQVSAVTKSVTIKEPTEQVWNTLVLGLRDYVLKNGFSSVILGLSGGIDSAVCAALAADAIGSGNVFGVSMPSKFSSEHSKVDAEQLAANLGLNFATQSIENFYTGFESELKATGVAAENLQARIRGIILMTESNSHGHLCISTGNKTEIAVGYSTIYGDSVGGFAPLKDVEKTMVWELARYRNRLATSKGEIAPIPESSINKKPSAELRENQTDQDSLPEYAVLDEILRRFIEERESLSTIVAAGFDETIVRQVLQLVASAEWKRRQGAIGPRITKLSFGRERRFPITNSFSEESID